MPVRDVLSGVRVIEVASWMFVPSACAILAEWGADVVKIEDPVRGDPQRGLISGMAVPQDGINFMVEIPNRGKRSVGVNIATDEGRALLYRLVAGADVFVTNHLPAVRAKLGIDVEAIRAANPGIVYVRGSAHGPRGDEADQGGFDVATYWARGGLASVLTPPDAEWPSGPRAGFGDLMAGMALAGGVAAALLKRERTGEAPVVDVSLLGLALWQLAPDVTAAGLYGAATRSHADRDALPNPLTGNFRTADGRFLTLMMIQSQPRWPDLCAHIDRADLADDPRYADPAARRENSRSLTAILRQTFGAHDLNWWCQRLATFRGVWAPVRTPLEQHGDPQVTANGYLSAVETMAGATLVTPTNPVQFDETAPGVRGAPEHGQHTEEVLLEAGLDYGELAALKSNGTIL
jgi:crotonobetainyl-CoA:carnitine CoA-transferase CaiB-like acyl-CoA transferase